MLHGTRDLSSLTKDRTHVSCIARWILNPWTTREVLVEGFLKVLVRSDVSWKADSGRGGDAEGTSLEANGTAQAREDGALD